MVPGSYGQPGGIYPVFTGARPDPDAAVIRGFMVRVMILTALGDLAGHIVCRPGGPARPGVAG